MPSKLYTLSCSLLLLPYILLNLRVFPMISLFISVGQIIGASSSASLLPMNIQGWFSLGLTGLISLMSKGLWRVLPAAQFKGTQLFSFSSSPICSRLLGKKKKKTIALTLQTFVGKVISLLFNILSRFLISFLPSRMCLLILCLQLLSIVILEPKKIVCHCCHCFPTYLPLND